MTRAIRRDPLGAHPPSEGGVCFLSPVETEGEQRWAVEGSFEFTKQVLGWEDVQLLDLEEVRMLVAVGLVAAGFLYELGVTLECRKHVFWGG